ncbi:UDP-N-acetylglucosamine 2-epimerase [Methanolobus psychrotolerans]|uniref:UDP-N-acetylglucosamine 2-epimerase n=1 Tax=Methanolobus psychrotolerans TaxID=1874706 RepID=UPI000B91C51F|nr:UDP-N-acetylglucosamine 2-epimerase [Methanolobus psychrotolerans]
MRRIAVITGSRGEYGYIRPIIKLIENDPDLDYELIVTNMHLLPDFGSSYREIEKDNLRISQKIPMTLAGYTNVTMAKSLAVFMLSITDTFERIKPDFILLAGDRGEQLISAIVGAHMNIPVAHIQAGELSGNVDGMSRHAITKFAHIHFASNVDASERLLKMGEEKFRVKLVGAPQLDEFRQGFFTSPEEIYYKFHLTPEEPLILLVQHPVTEESWNSGMQMEETLKAISRLKMQTLLVYPNNDAGSVMIQKSIEKHRKQFIHVERNLKREDYAGLMNVANIIVGNSSSALLEAPSFELPAVNIGRRQIGRLQGINVINVEHDSEKIEAAILKGLSKEFKQAVKGMENPYGDGDASQKIVDILKNVEIDQHLLNKTLTY